MVNTQLDYNFNMDCHQMPREFVNMDSFSLRALATYYRRMADLASNMAKKKEDYEEMMANVDYKYNRLRKIPIKVLDKVASNMKLNDAIKAIANDFGVSIDCVKIWYKKEVIAKNKDFIRYRDSVIIKLIALGLTYKSIAEYLNIHHNTVTRAVVKRELGIVLKAKDKAKIRQSAVIIFACLHTQNGS